MCASACKAASVKTHLGGSTHHKNWHRRLSPDGASGEPITDEELMEMYSAFGEIHGNKPYVSNRYHQVMGKKDPQYAAKRQRLSSGNQPHPATPSNPQGDATTSTPGSVPPQQRPTVPTTNHTQPRPEPPETTDQQDGGLDDWTVGEEPASVAVTAPPPELQTTTTPATERPGQSDPVNVARRSAAISFQKNWIADRSDGPTNRRY